MVSFASMPGMFDRTITIGSLGKEFSCTGWRTGYIVGNADVLKYIGGCQAYTSYSIF